MSKKKIFIGTISVIALVAVWFMYQITTAKPPALGNSAEGMKNFYKMQIEQQKKESE